VSHSSFEPPDSLEECESLVLLVVGVADGVVGLDTTEDVEDVIRSSAFHRTWIGYATTRTW
jgi:hypothetical protein